MDINSVATYFRQVAESRKPPSLDTVLHGLIRLFAVDAIGVSSTHPGSGEAACVGERTWAKQPWQADPSILEGLQTSLSAEAVPDGRGYWLLSYSADDELTWAYRGGKRNWSETEKWSWQFASQTLARWRARSGLSRQESLEHAALVTGRLSHDFGNYLTGILGFTELSLTQAPAEGLLHRYLQEVLQAAREGAAWVHRLHLFCRRTPAKPWPTLLPSLLTVEEARLRALGLQNVRWTVDLQQDLPLLDIDAGSLQTVLAELVNNAREACGDQGTITFTARIVDLTEAECCNLLGSARPGSHVELTIADDGPGIAPADRGRLLRELFFSTKPGHRGLGLLVVYGIIQRFHGGLRVVAGHGTGTAMQLYLPVAAIECAQPTAASSAHLLLVQANPLLLESMQRILESSGYRVTAMSSPQAALSACVTPGQSFNLVVTDVVLPQMSGLDLARRIMDRDSDVGFLFLHTQSALHGFAEDALLKRYPLLRWPFDPQALITAVQDALIRVKVRE